MILVCVRVDRILYVSHRNCNRKLQVIDLKYFLWHVSFLDNYWWLVSSNTFHFNRLTFIDGLFFLTFLICFCVQVIDAVSLFYWQTCFLLMSHAADPLYSKNPWFSWILHWPTSIVMVVWICFPFVWTYLGTHEALIFSPEAVNDDDVSLSSACWLLTTIHVWLLIWWSWIMLLFQ